MRKNIIFKLLVFLIVLMNFQTTIAQLPASFNEQENKLLLLDELYENNQLIAAKEVIQDLQKTNLDHTQTKFVAYYNCLIALKLNQIDGPRLVKNFRKVNQDFSKIDYLQKNLGDYFFKQKNYSRAAKEYERVDGKNLESDDLMSFYFKFGYSYFENENTGLAKKYLYRVKDTDSPYAPSAMYYYSHINYEETNYATALKGFESLREAPAFKSIVPYYISQIYYKEKKYQELLEVAPQLFEEAENKRKTEIAKIIGDAHFKLKQYEESIEYLEYYKSQVRSGYENKDYYQLAYAYMMSKDYENAIKYFERVGNQQDSITQNALYNLGNAYLKTYQKEFAGKAFYSAYQMNFDQKIQEDAMFNFAKISYELSNDPYNRAITAINTYLSNYPNSTRKNEAYAYLVNLFLSSKNYKGALLSLENIPNRNTDLDNAYQKIAYNRACELYDERRYQEALELYKKSMQYPYNKVMKLEAKYWAADCQYQQKNYYDAIIMWKELASDYKINQLKEAKNIPYNIAFSYYMVDNYTDAIVYFDLASKQKDLSKVMISDAYLRTGDCYYIMKDFSKAVELYGQAFEMKQNNAAYAMYQRSLAYGGMGNLNKKAEELNRFQLEYPKSVLADDALYELGTTYLIFEQNSQAISSFQKLVDHYPNSPFKKQALLKIGLTYYNMDQNENALQVLKQVVQNYSGTKESKEALVSIRNIYVESNAAEDFFVYVKNIPFANISNSEQDSISYMATENVYMNGNCEEAVPGFNKYLSQYPEGVFSINAHFYRAECLMKMDEFELALLDYQFVLSNSQAAFRESSLLKSARIYKFNKQFENALRNYQELMNLASNEIYIAESLDGQLECYHQMGKADSVLMIGKTILTSKSVPEQSMKKAHAYMANAALQTGDLQLANQEYTIVSKLMKGETAAEAKYQQAFIQFKLGNYKESEKVVFELINEFGSYDQWITKGFILLADIYVKYDNKFQAKQTLQSIIDHQEDSTLVNIALKKKKIIEELEAIEERSNMGPAETDSISMDEAGK